jgi:hypothetical protein
MREVYDVKRAYDLEIETILPKSGP